MKPTIDEQIEAVKEALRSPMYPEDIRGLSAALVTLNWVKRHAPTQTEPQLVAETNYRDVVSVALAFAEPKATSEDVVVRVMRALKGMTNPSSLETEIRRQRGS